MKLFSICFVCFIALILANMIGTCAVATMPFIADKIHKAGEFNNGN